MIRHVFCSSVIVGYFQKLFDNLLSTLSFISHLCNWCVFFFLYNSYVVHFVIFYVFFKVHDGAFVWCFVHRVPPIFMEVLSYDVGCACT